MQQITEIFYLLSNALLLPVMLLLLISLVRALIHSGRLLQEFLVRQQSASARFALETAILNDEDQWPLSDQMGEMNPIMRQLTLATADLPRLSYLVEQAELESQRRLERLRNLVKIGPALGLMGTLIPLGPALVGLAVGDIQTMSNNLVIAFSTTVLGLFIGLVGGFLASIRKHWHQADSALLNLAAERLCTRDDSRRVELSKGDENSRDSTPNSHLPSVDRNDSSQTVTLETLNV